MIEVDARQKDIRFSSRTRAGTDQFRKMQALRRAAAKLLDEMPKELRQSAEAELLAQEADHKVYNIIPLIYRARNYEGASKDYEFSRRTMEEHWKAGYSDMVRTLRHPEVLQRPTKPRWRFHLRPQATGSRTGETTMKLADVRKNAFAMPLNDPSYPKGPYKFYNREFVVISYRTDPERLRAVVPEPLEVVGDTVNYEFIRMPDSTGFGDYTETGQVIPVRFKDKDGTMQEGGYVHAMYLDDNSPIAGGREIWGFPKKLANPKVCHENETLLCTLHYGSVLCVTAHHGLQAPRDRSGAAAQEPGQAQLHDQDHPARRLHAAHLRAGALLPRGRDGEGRVVRPGGAAVLRPRDVRRQPPAGARGRLGQPLRHRPDLGPG